MSPVGRPDEAGSVVAIQAVDICPRSQGKLEKLKIAVGGRYQISAMLGGILHIYIRAGFNQKSSHFQVILVRGGD